MNHIAADDNDVLDLVDKNDNVIGTIDQIDAPNLLETKAGYVRGIAVFIQNDEGRLWIPRRTADKRIVPNGLDFSVAEHVQSGENYMQAVIRGFKEELLLDVNENDLVDLGKLQPNAAIPYFIIELFLYMADEVKDYNHADFSGFQWLLPHEIIKLIDAGEPSKDAIKDALLAYF